MLLAALLVCPFLLAQHTPPAGVIDGAKNPELVPDSTAYRLFFIATAESADATPEQRLRQKAKLTPIELPDADLELVIEILAGFKADYAERISQYNASVVMANESGVSPNLRAFIEDRDFLVQVTRDTLRSALKPDSMTRFDTYVQAQKRHMTVGDEIQ